MGLLSVDTNGWGTRGIWGLEIITLSWNLAGTWMRLFLDSGRTLEASMLSLKH